MERKKAKQFFRKFIFSEKAYRYFYKESENSEVMIKIHKTISILEKWWNLTVIYFSVWNKYFSEEKLTINNSTGMLTLKKVKFIYEISQ